MTRLEYVNFICGKIGQKDANSLALCAGFVQQRYKVVYDAYLWRDSLKNIAASLTDTTNGILDYPAGIDRIIAIRGSGDHRLTPFDSPLAFDIDPQVLERSGDPLLFEEYTDTAVPPVRHIRFVPIPSVTTALLIVGKLTIDDLTSDSSTPRLRNIDNALIAYGMGDMYERLRQIGKAQVKFQEGASLLKEMIDLETRQSASQPRVVPYVEPAYDFMDGDCDFGIFSKANNQGGAATATVPQFLSTSTPMNQGDDFLDITFVTPMSIVGWTLQGTVRNAIDATPLKLWPTTFVPNSPDPKTGFRVYFNDAPDSDNYSFVWRPES